MSAVDEVENQLSEYERKRLERIRKNEAYLESLGLLSHKAKMMQQTTQKTKRNQRRVAKLARAKPGEERRSDRLKSFNSPSAKDKPKLIMLSHAPADDRIEIAVEQEEYYYGSSPTSVILEKRLKRHTGSETALPTTASFCTTRRIAFEGMQDDFVLTDAEKEKLATIDSNYLEKFQEFLVYHNKISDQNVRNVMRQVTKLATGQGVRYESPKYGWKPHQVFQKGIKVTPLSDFVELMEFARKAEDEWGRDHGNGWLLSHPLKKMLLFQQFCLQNPDFLTSKRRLKEYYAMDDDVEEEKHVTDTVQCAAEVEIPNESESEMKTTESSLEMKATTGKKKSIASETEKEPLKKRRKISPKQYIGSRIAKKFEDGIVYYGKVKKYNARKKWWWIEYDDGDHEEMDAKDLHASLELYSTHSGKK
ncbi:hypothetical protein IV203_018186 [Nitzschia inconspicua]|uniref:PTM/DIR17-like Tudor domain-containing protein n=1 Tax=Nitzschia inconspicua TaxID=303405 RepID=A0A9K3Q5N4_9STRA|nr:hypothetical protein IV203_018186 [Nitzschia inconspicua]